MKEKIRLFAGMAALFGSFDITNPRRSRPMADQPPAPEPKTLEDLDRLGNDPWLPMDQLDFKDETQMIYHIDTRDYCGWSRSEVPPKFTPFTDLSSMRKLSKNPDWYIFTAEGVVDLLAHYEHETFYVRENGKIDHSVLLLTGSASHRAGNWQMKYITIYRVPGEENSLVVTAKDFIYPKTMLNEPICKR